MPRDIEDRLRRQAKKDGLRPGTERYNAYVYGTTRRIEEHKRKARRGEMRRR